MRRKIISKLKATFPKLDENLYFQIVGVGSIKRYEEDKTVIKVQVFFQKRYVTGGKKLVGDILSMWVNIYESMFLKVGSLWKNEGDECITLVNIFDTYSETIEIKDIKKNYKVSITTLNNCFPKYSFIPNLISDKIWGEFNNIHFCKLEKDNVIILVSCFELLRTLYYRGPTTIDYLYNSNYEDSTKKNSIQDYAKVITNPTNENDYLLEVTLHSNYYAESDIRLISELLISNNYNYVGQKTHAQILKNLPVENKNKELLFDIEDFDKNTTFIAVGVRVSYFDKQYFIVTSVKKMYNFFSFKKLKYSFDINNGKGNSIENLEDIVENSITHSFVATHNNITPPIINSDIQGHSLTQHLECYVEIGDETELPVMIEDTKLLQKAKYKYGPVIFPNIPSVLSQGTGGNDKDVVSADIVGDSDTNDFEGINQVTDFHKIAKQLGSIANIKLMELNKSTVQGISNFPYTWTNQKDFYYIDDTKKQVRQVGIVELLNKDSYFYLINIFNAYKRAAFVYKDDLSQISDNEINYLLFCICDYYGNWTMYKRKLEKNDIRERRLLDKFKQKIHIKLRNIYEKEKIGENQIIEKLDAERVKVSCLNDINSAIENKNRY